MEGLVADACWTLLGSSAPGTSGTSASCPVSRGPVGKGVVQARTQSLGHRQRLDPTETTDTPAHVFIPKEVGLKDVDPLIGQCHTKPHAQLGKWPIRCKYTQPPLQLPGLHPRNLISQFPTPNLSEPQSLLIGTGVSPALSQAPASCKTLFCQGQTAPNLALFQVLDLRSYFSRKPSWLAMPHIIHVLYSAMLSHSSPAPHSSLLSVEDGLSFHRGTISQNLYLQQFLSWPPPPTDMCAPPCSYRAQVTGSFHSFFFLKLLLQLSTARRRERGGKWRGKRKRGEIMERGGNRRGVGGEKEEKERVGPER